MRYEPKVESARRLVKHLRLYGRGNGLSGSKCFPLMQKKVTFKSLSKTKLKQET